MRPEKCFYVRISNKQSNPRATVDMVNHALISLLVQGHGNMCSLMQTLAHLFIFASVIFTLLW